MKVYLYEIGERESKQIYSFDSDVVPCVGDQVNSVNVGEFIVRRRVFDVMKIGMVGDPDVTTIIFAQLYVQPVEAFKRELAQVKSDEA